jgi:septum formation protein
MTLWIGKSPLVLASQSLTRQTLLAHAGLEFDVVYSDIDERAVQQDSGLTTAREIALLLACAKALTASASQPGRFVIGADQTLARGERLFAKPTDRAQAAEQLSALSGGRHELYSAAAVARDGEIVFAEAAVAAMMMRRLTPSEIDTYLEIAGETVLSSVGAYQLEGLGIHLFEQIEGDHFTILGLPLLPLLAFFRRERLLAM